MQCLREVVNVHCIDDLAGRHEDIDGVEVLLHYTLKHSKTAITSVTYKHTSPVHQKTQTCVGLLQGNEIMLALL